MNGTADAHWALLEATLRRVFPAADDARIRAWLGSMSAPVAFTVAGPWIERMKRLRQRLRALLARWRDAH
ncbi:MAG: hypothetical protein GY856_51055 [bacterium]|nr:hypothetical protein [bacterium]